MRRRRGSRMVWAFLASILIHATLLPAMFWTWSKNLPIRTEPREQIVFSSAVRLERRPVPQPPSHRAIARVTAAAPPPRGEIARVVPLASPEPERTAPPQRETLAQQLAQQEREFAQEVARLNQRQNPLSLASPSQTPGTYERSYFDAPGHTQHNAVLAVLIPLRHWMAQGSSCYYVRYVAQYTTGGSEEGVIPWPVCYPADDDRMAHPRYPHDLPIPFPQRDYVLPPGTYLAPLLQSVYNRRPT
jgi:hypothetical protein